MALASRLAVLAVLAATSVALPARAADSEAPKISHQAITEAAAGVPLTVSATITDESQIFEPTLYYREAGTKKFLSASMTPGAGATFAATIPETATRTNLEYFIEAYDSNGNGPSRFASDKAPQFVRVNSKSEPPKVATAEPKPSPAGPRPLDAAVAGSKAAPGTGRVGGEAAAVREEAEPGGGLGGMKIAGFALAGTGAAALVAGGLFGLQAKGMEKDAQEAVSASEAQSKYNDAKSKATLANITFVAGGVLAAAGIVLAVLPSGASADSASQAPAPKHDKDSDRFDSRLDIGPGGAMWTMRF
jgi:hypothetical protein